MRELKFRFWQKATRNYIYFALRKGVCLEFNIEPELEQYTGLKDRNGKEIYEGDIVKDKWSDDFYTGIYKVEFDLDRAGFVPFAHGDGCGCCEADTIRVTDDVEIVGNIHENPELLEEEK